MSTNNSSLIAKVLLIVLLIVSAFFNIITPTNAQTSNFWPISPLKSTSTISAGYNTSNHGNDDDNRADLMALDLRFNGAAYGTTEVVAAATGELWYKGSCSVVLRHGDLYTSYLHITPKSGLIQGQNISVGTTIGNLAKCGQISGPHVHFMLNKWKGSGFPIREFPFKSNWEAVPLNICNQAFPYSGAANQHLSKTVATCSSIFADVPLDHFALRWTEQLYLQGITSGCAKDPLRYCPENRVTRAEMAVFLLRVKYGSNYQPPPATGIFSDVPTNHWAARWIEQLYRDGITSGCSKSPLRYCPDNQTTRAEIAIFLLRVKYGSNYQPPPTTGIFSDVPTNHWAAKWIEQLYRDGITSGCSKNPLRYCPDNQTTRAEMAIFLLRVKHGSNYQP